MRLGGEASVVVLVGSVLNRSEGCFGRRKVTLRILVPFASLGHDGFRRVVHIVPVREPLLEPLNRTLGLIYRFFQSSPLSCWVQTT